MPDINCIYPTHVYSLQQFNLWQERQKELKTKRFFLSQLEVKERSEARYAIASPHDIGEDMQGWTAVKLGGVTWS